MSLARLIFFKIMLFYDLQIGGNFSSKFCCFAFFVAALRPYGKDAVPFESWNYMHMQMENALTCRSAVVLKDVYAVTAGGFLDCRRNLLCYRKDFLCDILRQLKDVGRMNLRKDDSVSFMGRCDIKYGTEIIIFIYCGGRNLAVCYLTKNTVTHGKPPDSCN